MVIKQSFFWLALLMGSGSIAAQIKAAPPSGPAYRNVSLAFRYSPPDGMSDEIGRPKSSAPTQTLGALLAISSGPDSDASDWGSVTIETYPRKKLNLDDLSAEAKMSAWVAGTSDLPGKPRSVVLRGQNFVIFVVGKQDGGIRKGAVIWTTIRKDKLLSFAFAANSPEQLKRLTETMKSVQFF